MNAEKLRSLAERIAVAEPDDEKVLFGEALPLLANGVSPEPGARWHRCLRVGAFHELAAGIFTAQCAGWGFQFGSVAGPAPTGIATIWRAGDAQSAIHKAATASLALLCATATEAANALDAQTAAHCPACAGRGWFVTAANRKQLCRHERVAA